MNTSLVSPRRIAVLLVSLPLIIGGFGSAAAGPQEKSFRSYKARTLEELGPFDFERRAYMLETINELSMQCHGLPQRKVIASASTKTIGDGPILSLIDVDGDKKPEQFAYAEQAGPNTAHFGYLWDLNGDGKADWLTFNQGTMIAEPMKIVWTSYHMIDTNYDGKADVWIYPDTDLNADGKMEEGVFAWIYDSDFDGGIDGGEYLGQDVAEAMECTDDRIRTRCVLSKELLIGEPGPLDFATAMLTDINKLLE